MPNKNILKKKIPNFSQNISIPGDKSISIRWVLISSLANGISTAKNLLLSEDVLAAIVLSFVSMYLKKFIKN